MEAENRIALYELSDIIFKSRQSNNKRVARLASNFLAERPVSSNFLVQMKLSFRGLVMMAVEYLPNDRPAQLFFRDYCSIVNLNNNPHLQLELSDNQVTILKFLIKFLIHERKRI